MICPDKGLSKFEIRFWHCSELSELFSATVAAILDLVTSNCLATKGDADNITESVDSIAANFGGKSPRWKRRQMMSMSIISEM